MNHKKYLALAAQVSRLKNDERSFFIGAVGIRSDGIMVAAANGPARIQTRQAHSEARISRKLDKHATVYVARTLKNGAWAISKPCEDCQRALKRAKVKRVYYTISDNEFGCLIL